MDPLELLEDVSNGDEDAEEYSILQFQQKFPADVGEKKSSVIGSIPGCAGRGGRQARRRRSRLPRPDEERSARAARSARTAFIAE